jgi:hypothetical protein
MEVLSDANYCGLELKRRRNGELSALVLCNRLLLAGASSKQAVIIRPTSAFDPMNQLAKGRR